MFQALAAQRLLALFAAGGLVFNFPLLSVWDPDATLFGIPLFPAVLFIAWAVLIAGVCWINERSAEDYPQKPAAD